MSFFTAVDNVAYTIEIYDDFLGGELAVPLALAGLVFPLQGPDVAAALRDAGAVSLLVAGRLGHRG